MNAPEELRIALVFRLHMKPRFFPFTFSERVGCTFCITSVLLLAWSYMRNIDLLEIKIVPTIEDSELPSESFRHSWNYLLKVASVKLSGWTVLLLDIYHSAHLQQSGVCISTGNITIAQGRERQLDAIRAITKKDSLRIATNDNTFDYFNAIIQFSQMNRCSSDGPRELGGLQRAWRGSSVIGPILDVVQGLYERAEPERCCTVAPKEVACEC